MRCLAAAVWATGLLLLLLAASHPKGLSGGTAGADWAKPPGRPSCLGPGRCCTWAHYLTRRRRHAWCGGRGTHAWRAPSNHAPPSDTRRRTPSQTPVKLGAPGRWMRRWTVIARSN
jgi:hypothetical protein